MAATLRTADLAESDLELALDIQSRSFGPMPESRREAWFRGRKEAIAAGRVIGGYDGSRLVAHARLRPFRQFWGGRELSMAGMAGVVVTPDYRGQGVASQLMSAAAQRAGELGDVLSALYPSVPALYRGVGWELAGVQHRITIDPDWLRRLGHSSADVRLADAESVGQMIDLMRAHWTATGASGPKLLEPEELRDALGETDTWGYLTDDGFVVYGWYEGDLYVTHLLAASESSLRALWSVVGSGASIARSVHAFVAPHDPVHFLLDRPAASAVEQGRWMLRLIDAPTAIGERGYPVSPPVDVSLTVADPIAPGCDGSWRLRIADGTGSLERAPEIDDALRLGANGLAAMYAGTPLATLRSVGLATGGQSDVDRQLDAAFAADPYLLEYF
ncbi:MAG TPA: GNAT family N-acetyltransferase [Nocardioidaceae bacterium]|nr:GNAT family N-acetyltransferase [Nocardioidaceae bacterium]